MDDLVSRRIRDYLIEAEIGRGGMGRVYRARQLTLDRVCAIKVLRPDLAADEEYRRRFLQEARSAAALDHPNIVAVHDAGEVDGVYYIAMQYVNGTSLAERLVHGPLTLDEVIRIITPVAGALDYAHQEGLIHRDIKPGNILIDREGQVWLTDFGLARATGASTRLTASGLLVGTPAYMAPEQISGGAVTLRTDIYQLGITIYELLTGRTPFDERPAAATLLAHFQEPPLPAHEVNPALSAGVSSVIERAIHKLPEDRHATASQFVEELRKTTSLPGEGVNAATVEAPLLPPRPERYPGSSDETTERSPPAQQEAQPRHFGRYRMAAAGVVGVVALAGMLGLAGFIFLSNGDDDPPQGPTPTSEQALNISSEAPARGEVIAAPDPTELWPPGDFEGMPSFERDGQYHVRMEVSDATYFKQALGMANPDGSAYFEVAMTEIASTYQEACLHTRIAREADGAYRGYQFCLTGTAESYAEYYEYDAGGNAIVTEILVPFNIAAGSKSPSDFNALEVVMQGERLWFFINDTAAGSAQHAGSTAGDFGVSLVRDGPEPAEFVFGALGFLELEE